MGLSDLENIGINDLISAGQLTAQEAIVVLMSLNQALQDAPHDLPSVCSSLHVSYILYSSCMHGHTTQLKRNNNNKPSALATHK